jgi:hypothetical protein
MTADDGGKGRRARERIIRLDKVAQALPADVCQNTRTTVRWFREYSAGRASMRDLLSVLARHIDDGGVFHGPGESAVEASPAAPRRRSRY